MKKQKLNIKHLIVVFFILFGLSTSTKAQKKLSSIFLQIEQLQDENLEYLKKIYRIINNYPAFSYTYEMEGGELKDVTVTGINNELDRKRVEIILFDLESNRNMLQGKSNRLGVFYSVDKKPVYKNGMKGLQSELQKNLEYPTDAKDWGVEGTVFVKFVVDQNGNIPFVTTDEDIETSADYYVEDLEQQAVAAVKETSGDWKPGKVQGVEVPSLLILPVTFDIKKQPGISAYIH